MPARPTYKIFAEVEAAFAGAVCQICSRDRITGRICDLDCFPAADDFRCANDVRQLEFTEGHTFDVVENIMCFGKREHRTAASPGRRPARFHVGADRNSRQNDLKINILEKSLKHGSAGSRSIVI